jgi:hypothetical protein
MLISNPQHAVSLLQAHLALETHLPFRLIWHWKRLYVGRLAASVDTGGYWWIPPLVAECVWQW